MLPRYANGSIESGYTEDDLLPLWRASEPTGDNHPRTSTSVKTSQSSSQPTLVRKEPPKPKMERTGSLPTPTKTDMPSHSEEDEKASWYNSLRKKTPTRKSTRFDPERALPSVESEHPLKPSRNPPVASFFDYFPILIFLKPLLRLIRLSRRKSDEGTRTILGRKKQPELRDSNVPLEITLYLSGYLAWLLRNALLTPAIATGMVTNIAALQDTLTNLDRIRNTPIPFAYRAFFFLSVQG
jgi:ion channel-forming bestrophin family protein